MGPTWHRLIFQFGSRTKPFSDAHLPRSGPHLTGGGSLPSTRISSTSYMMHQFQAPKTIKSFSAHASSGNGYDENHSTGSVESADEFERRIFGGNSRSSPNSDAFFRKLDELEKARNKSGDRNHGGSGSSILDGLEDSFSTLSDGMDGKLKKAATYFEFDEEEILQDDYTFRPDMKFWRGMTYNVKDLDLTKTRVSKPPKRQGFEVTTEEVLSKADFRNVKFLANFITESGIIIKRSQTRISAKAQRKVAREIKTARAFGLMPFTTMGTKSFVYGKTMEDLDEDYEYENFDSQVVADENE